MERIQRNKIQKDQEDNLDMRDMYSQQLDLIMKKRQRADVIATQAVQQHWKENRKTWKIKRNINRFKKALPGLNEEDV